MSQNEGTPTEGHGPPLTMLSSRALPNVTVHLESAANVLVGAEPAEKTVEGSMGWNVARLVRFC